MIDLHTHSTASDGTLGPEALVDLAAEKGLTAMALTDHDTVQGLPAALARGEARGVQVIPGIELGARWTGSGALHILGYYVRPDDAALRARLAWLCARRRERVERILGRLRELGIEVPLDRVEAVAGGPAMGRPHVARALVEAGVARSLGEAFGRYLTPGRTAYVEREQLSAPEAIGLIKSSGGVAVLAHPASLKLARRGGLAGSALEQCLKQLKAAGLDGIEVYWSGHSARQVEDYRGLARRLKLVITGGSDFHGANKPGVELGTGRKGNLRVPDSLLEALEERRLSPAPRSFGAGLAATRP